MMIRKIFTFCFVASLFLAVAIPLLLFHSPASHGCCSSSYKEKETDFFLNHYGPAFFERTANKNNDDKEKTKTNISVMSFNVRLDAKEENPDNHFTKRVFRLSDTIQKWQPTIIGMQEPFGGQVEHLLSIVNLKSEQEVEERKRRDGISPDQEKNLHRNDTTSSIVGKRRRRVTYKALGYNRPGIDQENRVHPARHMDFRAGILYRPDQLELLEQGYIRLTTTPDAEREEVLRVGNIARFRVLLDDDNENKNENEKSKEILHFNTHLCVKSEKARRTQSALLIDEIAKWKRKYPDAIVFVTGDFNSAPGQAAHRTLLGSASDEEIFAKSSVNSKSFLSSSQEERSQLLLDTYERCSATIASSSSETETEKNNCIFGNDLALSFNGWLPATFVDSYLARWGFGRLAFTLHAMQFKLPLSPPWGGRAMARGVIDFVSSAPEYSVSESLPKSFTRLHVDWILHDQKLAKPKMFHVADARDEKLSSDHFPVVAVFEI